MPVRDTVLIIADNKIKKFGEKLPDFTATVTVNGHSLQDAGLTLTDLGLDSIHYTLPSGLNSLSNTGKYFIDPSAGPFDIGLREHYEYIFITHSNFTDYGRPTPSLLTIEKMALKIIPLNDTL